MFPTNKIFQIQQTTVLRPENVYPYRRKKNNSRLSFKLRRPESHLFHDLIEEENSDNEEPENPPIGICRENTQNTHSKNCFKDRRQMCKNIKALINVIELGGNLLRYKV